MRNRETINYNGNGYLCGYVYPMKVKGWWRGDALSRTGSESRPFPSRDEAIAFVHHHGGVISAAMREH